LKNKKQPPFNGGCQSVMLVASDKHKHCLIVRKDHPRSKVVKPVLRKMTEWITHSVIVNHWYLGL
jgi:hypothetical protein